MRVAWNNFTAGEVARTLSARYNFERFTNWSQAMRNMLPGLHGDVARRPGTLHVATLPGYSVLIPFSFNSEAEQNFVLVFSDQELRVSNGRDNLSPPIATPYAAEDLLDISWAQVGDVVYLAHKKYPLHKVVRTESGTSGVYAWGIEEVILNQSVAAPAAPTVTFERNNGNDDAPLNYPLRYKVVAVGPTGLQSLASESGSVTGKHPSDWVTGNRVNITWTAVEGAVEYNIYREEAGYFGFIGVSTGTSFMDNNYEADTSDTPREDWDPFADGNNPGVVAFHQQRMVLGGTQKASATFYMSRTGDFENFRKARPLQDDDPVEYMIASGAINAITWIASFGDLLIGTTGAEYKATGENGVITPKVCYVTAQSYWGSAALTPLIIGNSVLHMQRHGSRVRDLYYSLEKDGYAGNDLSILAPHFFEGYTIRQWAYQQTPGSHVWCVRNDGALLALTYLKEQQIAGWTLHPTDGAVQSVATISGENSDALLLVVKRQVNGADAYFLERMAEPFDQTQGIADACFVDCGKTQTRATATDTMTGLEHLEGREVAVLADGSPVAGCVVENGSITIPYPAKVIHAGLPYTSVVSPLPVEAQVQNGVTLGKMRGYGKVVVRLFRSVGGKYGADMDHLYEFPFHPAKWAEAVQPFTGDLECLPLGGQATDASVYLVQDKPLPWHIIAIMADVDFGEV